MEEKTTVKSKPEQKKPLPKNKKDKAAPSSKEHIVHKNGGKQNGKSFNKKKAKEKKRHVEYGWYPFAEFFGKKEEPVSEKTQAPKAETTEEVKSEEVTA